ncbi:hypothetical protein SH611_20965 [Geminicoccaceae bacterium 1502E]|nr:hypothetical protein [Geminicoccaceae bacterium 1502E]
MPPEAEQPDEGQGVVFKPKGTTHQLVCSCTCASCSLPKKVITLDPIGGSCDPIVGAECDVAGNKGAVDACTKKVEPKSLILIPAEALLGVPR